MNSYKKFILDNGIPVYLYNDKSLKQVFFDYIVKYGSNGKWFDFKLDGVKYHMLPGCAHFLEHLLGERSKYGNMYDNFDRRCYYSNAYTGNENTQFLFYGVKDIKKSIKELIEAMECPVFDKKDVEKTRPAIIDEVSACGDSYSETALCLVENNLYKNFNVYDKSLCSIGSRNTTHQITVDDLRCCYNAFYTDDRKVIVIAGNLDEKEMIDYLNEVYSHIPKHQSNLILPKYDMDPIKKKDATIYRDVECDIASLGIKVKKPDELSLRELVYCFEVLLENIFSPESDFYTYLMGKSIVETIDFYYYNINEDYINFMNNVTTNNRHRYYDIILEKINKVDLTKADYELIRKDFYANQIRQMEDKYAMPSMFCDRMYYTKDYGDLDFIRSIDYNRFMDMYNTIDFSKYTKGQVKRLRK